MRRRHLVGALGIAIALVFGIPAMFTAASGAAERSCDALSLHGAYAYSADGFVTTTPGQPPFTPIAEAGTYTFDGAGEFSTANTVSVGGHIIPRTATGTYTVNADCTGSVSVTGGVTFNFAITRAGESLRLVVSTPGVAVMGTMEKQ